MKRISMTLANGKEIELESFVIPMDAIVHVENREALAKVWTELESEGCLSTVSLSEDGEVIYIYDNVTIDGVQCIYNGDKSLTAHFYLSGEPSRLNAEYIRAAKIMLGEEEA